MNSKAVALLLQGIVVVFYLLVCSEISEAANHCKQPVGKVVSIQGDAQVQRYGVSGWQTVAMDAELCPGDILRVAANSRATVLLSSEALLRVDQKSTVTFPKPSKEGYSVLDLLQGVLHIFSHRPRSLKVVTPYVNAMVEGTEFLVSVDSDKSFITVFEGLVSAINQHGKIQLASNQSAVAKEGTAPVYTTVVNPRDAVDWTLYYPAIVGKSDPETINEITELLSQAAAYLSVGRVQEAHQALTRVLQIDPQNSDAYAYSSIIETVRNKKEKALKDALQAVGLNPTSPSAALALSYARQARFELAEAMEVLEQAEQANPQHALLNARLAELLVSAGKLDEAMAAAKKAVDSNPEIGLTQTVLGFVYLSRMEVEQAKTAFSKAIILDSAFPLARLGLGLAKIRTGMLEEGRAGLEIAAALDPGNALIRSYLGKAYFEEKRDNLSHRQYEIAKELDPADPTPWFYDAIRKQTINRPVEALHDLQHSIALNDNRAVYRSRLLLDDDLASRSAGLGRIYNDLGFQQLARVEGLKSIQADPTNYSAHRFLADTYQALPRHEIARVSELLQSQLLQPLNVTPVQPQLAESNLSILEGSGPTAASFYEFNPLFLRDRVALQASGVYGSNDIFGDEIVVSGVQGRLSYSLGQFHYETDGIRENNDQEEDIYNLFVQGALSPKASVMAEIRYQERDFGDRTFPFNPADFSSALRQAEEGKSARLGARYDINANSKLIGTAIIGTVDGNVAIGLDKSSRFSMAVDFASEVDSQMAEVQHMYHGAAFNLQSGAGYLTADRNLTMHITFPLDLLSEEETRMEHTNLYSYAQVELPYNFEATIGLSGDLLDSPLMDREELNPKLGLTYQPWQSTLFRAAAYQTVARNFIHAQTVEPTMIAGFNQYYDYSEGTVYQTYGAAIDHSFSANLFGGVQYYHRNLDVPFFDVLETGEIVSLEGAWEENIGSAYFYWTPVNQLALGLDFYNEQYSREGAAGGEEIRELKTQRITPAVHFFHPCGFNATAAASYIDQEGEFGQFDSGFVAGSDQFWVVDLALRYRLPKRYGVVSLAVKNLFDEQFMYLDTDPANPRFLPEQQIIGSLTVAF